jgi:predicted RNA methylase
LRRLEERLQSISTFERPKVALEQYVTPPHLGCHVLHTMQSQYGDVAGKAVADLGCGCGALSIGAAVLDAAVVVGFEVDADALDVFRENVEDQGVSNVDAVQCDVNRMPDRSDVVALFYVGCTVWFRFHKQFDTVVMNPPFGTKHNEGIDMKFLQVALRLANNVVYSLHKTSTRSHVLKVAESLGAKGEVLAELRYDLPSTFKFHKKKSVDIQVDFFRFQIL